MMQGWRVSWIRRVVHRASCSYGPSELTPLFLYTVVDGQEALIYTENFLLLRMLLYTDIDWYKDLKYTETKSSSSTNLYRSRQTKDFKINAEKGTPSCAAV